MKLEHRVNPQTIAFEDKVKFVLKVCPCKLKHCLQQTKSGRLDVTNQATMRAQDGVARGGGMEGGWIFEACWMVEIGTWNSVCLHVHNKGTSRDHSR